MAEEILANTVNDISNRGATNETLARFKGKPRQLVINIDDNYRPVIMDGSTLGGKFKAASIEELNNVKTTADNALTKEQGDEYYLGKTANATSASKLETARTIELSGAVTGTATSFDGSGNITIPVTSVDASKVTGTLSINTTGNASTATTATTCTGNAATATKATQDASGNIIIDTYATKTELNSVNSSTVELGSKVNTLETNLASLTTNTSDNSESISTLEASIDDLNTKIVTLEDTQTINGEKTFTVSPIVPTVDSEDESTKAASTAFVKSLITSSVAPTVEAKTFTASVNLSDGDLLSVTLSATINKYGQLTAFTSKGVNCDTNCHCQYN